MLNEESRKRVKELCDQIAKEHDHGRFSQLISELNRILEASGARKEVSGNTDGSAKADGRSEVTPANRQPS